MIKPPAGLWKQWQLLPWNAAR